MTPKSPTPKSAPQKSNDHITKIGGCSFIITIHHTENNSWQGAIEWLDTRQKIHFRSALEMMQLLDQAVQISTEKEPPRQWSNAKENSA